MTQSIASSSNGNAPLAWIHAAFLDHFAAGWLLIEGSLDAVHQRNELLDWVEPLALASQMDHLFAERAVDVLLGAGGTATGSAAARLAAVAPLTELTLERVLAAALGFEGPKPRLSEARTIEQYRDNVRVLAPMFGPRLLEHFIAHDEAVEIGIVARWWPEEACLAFSHLLLRNDGQDDWSTRQQAVKELGQLGQQSARTARAALAILRTVKHTTDGLPFALRCLYPIPETAAAVVEFGVPENPRMAWVLLSALAHVGAIYPDVVPNAAMEPLWNALPAIENWDVLADTDLLLRTHTALQATQDPDSATTARALAELFARHCSSIETLASSNEHLSIDQSGGVPRDVFVAVTSFWDTVATSSSDPNDIDRGATLLTAFLADQPVSVAAWRCWLFQILRAETTGPSTAYADLDLARELQSTEAVEPIAEDTNWEVFTRLFPAHVGRGWLQMAGDQVAANLSSADERTRYAAEHALEELAESHPWTTLIFMLEYEPRDPDRHLWRRSVLLRASERAVLQAPRAQLRSHVVPRIRDLLDNQDSELRYNSLFVVYALGTRDWAAALPLLQYFERDQRNLPYQRDRALEVKRNLLERYGNGITGDADIDLMRRLITDSDHWLIRDQWNRVTLRLARVQAVALWPIERMWKPPVKAWPEPWSTVVHVLVVLPQALLLLVVWGLPIFFGLFAMWLVIQVTLAREIVTERLREGSIQYRSARRGRRRA